MKFSREYEASIIPEWKGAFVDYKRLKRIIKKIKVSRRHHHDSTTLREDEEEALVAGAAFSVRALAARSAPRAQDSPEDEERSYSSGELVQPMDTHEREFVERADEELDKVNNFYATQEAELLGSGEALMDQLRILTEVKRILADHAVSRRAMHFSPSGSTPPPDIYLPRRRRRSMSDEGSVELQQAQMTEGAAVAEEVVAALERNGVSVRRRRQLLPLDPGGGKKDARKEHGNKARAVTVPPRPPAVRIDIPATNPGRTALKVWEELVNVLRKDGAHPAAAFIRGKKIQHAEKNIRDAFMALYRGLDLLNNFRSLNVKAFTKILKKFVKVSEQRRATTLFSEKVKGSSFSTSDKVVKLSDKVESLFMKNFAGNDRMVAMKYLKPRQNKSTHMITFFVGLFTGTFVSLFIIYAILAHVSGILASDGHAVNMAVVYHVISIFPLISLHCFLYGCNLFMWKKTRINQIFIFDFASNTALTHRDAFLMSASIMCAAVAALVIDLFLRNAGASYTNAVPGALLVLSTGVLVCPFNVFYRSTRYCLMRILRNIVFSPFYKVVMADFFMADQLTSQMRLLRHMEFAACYFIAGRFMANPYETCTNSQNYKHLAYVISFLPYYWRAMQCLRRYLDEHDTNQLANTGKYVSAMVAAAVRFKYSITPAPFWMWMVIVSSSGATIYQLYWDFVKDWGFFTPKSKNLLLRDELILKNKSIYYVSMVLNLALRLAWMERLMDLHVSKYVTRRLDFSLASLEIIRRGHWNFYRLENEHLNNVGKFRAVKTVPLPFSELGTD